MLINTLLEQIPFFYDFTQEERQVFAENDNFFVTFQDGECVIREGDYSDALFVLIRGQLIVKKNGHDNKIIAILEPGAVVGEVSFLTKRVRSTHVFSQGEDVLVFKIDSNTIAQEKLESRLEVKIKNKLVEMLVQRLEETNLALVRQKEANLVLTKALRAKMIGD